MLINFITLFPEKILTYFRDGLHAKAIQRGVFQIRIIHLRDFSEDKFGRVDDTVYGGGPGMLLKVEPLDRALEFLGDTRGKVILLSPSGKTYNQEMAFSMKSMENITFISGYYEGVDHRIVEQFVDIELSIGNYVISSGDLAALCVADSLVRLLPGFMGGEESLLEESHNQKDLLEYPQYTKPAEYKGWKVPDVLLSGNHEMIRKWKEGNRKTPPT